MPKRAPKPKSRKPVHLVAASRAYALPAGLCASEAELERLQRLLDGLPEEEAFFVEALLVRATRNAGAEAERPWWKRRHAQQAGNRKESQLRGESRTAREVRVLEEAARRKSQGESWVLIASGLCELGDLPKDTSGEALRKRVERYKGGGPTGRR